jgi:hypothetical protein
MEQIERIEQVFDSVFIELAGLSDGSAEFDELDQDSDRLVFEARCLVERYDDIAARARRKFTKLRRLLLDAMSNSA